MEAFITLCGERGIGNISIADIARRARVNRATFYNHFEDKSDLAGRGLDLLLVQLGEIIDENATILPDSAERALLRVERIFQVLGERRSFFLSLLSGAAGPAFRKRIDAFIENYISERRIERFLPNETFSVPREMLPRVVSSLFIGLASWWLENPAPYDAKEMAKFYLSIFAHGVEILGLPSKDNVKQ